MAEERRLFYVALTRAEEKLWLLTETNRESQFLKELALPITPIPPHTKTVVRDSKTVLNQWTG